MRRPLLALAVTAAMLTLATAAFAAEPFSFETLRRVVAVGSTQVGAWQTSSVQTPLLQSAGSRQVFASSHGAHDPPQSTSVSSPFFNPSMQSTATHV